MPIEFVVFDLDAVADIQDASLREVFGMTPSLRRLRARGLGIAVTAARHRMDAHDALSRLGWLGGELVDVCVTASDVPRMAPFPDMIPYAMKELGARDPSRVAKVSGTPLGLLQGATAGCSILIGVTDRGVRESVLRGAPCTHIAPTAALVPELLDRVSRASAPVGPSPVA